MNDFTNRVTHLVDEDGKQQVVQHRVFTPAGFSRAFRRTAHLFQRFLDSADWSRLQCIFPEWDPYYNDMPLCTPCPCLYRRLHGFGRDHSQVSTGYTDVAPYFLFHMAWPFLDPASRRVLCDPTDFPVMGAYAKLRFDSCTAPIHILRQPRPPYNGEPLDNQRVLLYAMALLRFDFNYGDFARFLGGEYTYQHRDWQSVFSIMETFAAQSPPTTYADYKKGDQPPADLDRARRVADVGIPLVGHYKCSYASVQQRNQYNNHPNIIPVRDMIANKLAKEEALSFQVVFPRWIWRFIVGIFLASISFRSPKHEHDDGRICTDLATFLFAGDDGNLNTQIRRPARHNRPTELSDPDHLDENPPIYYGYAFFMLLKWIWNLRLDHPREDILLATNDISAAFHRILYNCGMAICFAVVFEQYLAVPVGNVFGATNSASLYMLMGEMRSWLSRVADFGTATTELTQRVELSRPPTPREIASFAGSVRDSQNPGSNTLRSGPLQLGPQPSFVDDSGIADVVYRIMTAINNSHLSAYVTFGFPKEDSRRPAINAQKFDAFVSWILKFLGFIINTREMTVTWPADKRQRLANLLATYFLQPLAQRPPLTPKIVSQILGLVRNGALVSPYGVYLSLRLQYALNDAVSAASQKQRHSHRWWNAYTILPRMDVYHDAQLLHATLSGPNAENYWTRKIGLLIDRDPTATLIGDACYEGMGAFCAEEKCMWRLSNADLLSKGFDIPPDDDTMLARIREAKEKGDTSTVEHLTHNNILEFVTIIIHLWLVIRCCMLNPNHDSETLHVFHPRTDNTSGLSWLTHAARTKRAPVRRLARFCQYLLTTAPIHIRLQPSHIAGMLNDDADLTSRPKTRAPTWASVIEQGSPILRTCQIYLIPPGLLSLIARTIRSDVNAAELENAMIELWTLVPTTLPSGSLDIPSTSGISTRSHRKRRRR